MRRITNVAQSASNEQSSLDPRTVNAPSIASILTKIQHAATDAILDLRNLWYEHVRPSGTSSGLDDDLADPSYSKISYQLTRLIEESLNSACFTHTRKLAQGPWKLGTVRLYGIFGPQGTTIGCVKALRDLCALEPDLDQAMVELTKAQQARQGGSYRKQNVSQKAEWTMDNIVVAINAFEAMGRTTSEGQKRPKPKVQGQRTASKQRTKSTQAAQSPAEDQATNMEQETNGSVTTQALARPDMQDAVAEDDTHGLQAMHDQDSGDGGQIVEDSSPTDDPEDEDVDEDADEDAIHLGHNTGLEATAVQSVTDGAIAEAASSPAIENGRGLSIGGGSRRADEHSSPARPDLLDMSCLNTSRASTAAPTPIHPRYSLLARGSWGARAHGHTPASSNIEQTEVDLSLYAARDFFLPNEPLPRISRGSTPTPMMGPPNNKRRRRSSDDDQSRADGFSSRLRNRLRSNTADAHLQLLGSARDFLSAFASRTPFTVEQDSSGTAQEQIVTVREQTSQNGHCHVLALIPPVHLGDNDDEQQPSVLSTWCLAAVGRQDNADSIAGELFSVHGSHSNRNLTHEEETRVRGALAKAMPDDDDESQPIQETRFIMAVCPLILHPDVDDSTGYIQSVAIATHLIAKAHVPQHISLWGWLDAIAHIECPTRRSTDHFKPAFELPNMQTPEMDLQNVFPFDSAAAISYAVEHFSVTVNDSRRLMDSVDRYIEQLKIICDLLGDAHASPQSALAGLDDEIAETKSRAQAIDNEFMQKVLASHLSQLQQKRQHLVADDVATGQSTQLRLSNRLRSWLSSSIGEASMMKDKVHRKDNTRFEEVERALQQGIQTIEKLRLGSEKGRDGL